MAKFGFDSSEVDVNEQVSFDPVPAGEYTLKALEAEEKPTKSGDGSYIAVKFEICKGEYEGRKVWANFNINNPSEKAQKIGRQQIVSWATAAGKPNASDTDALIERPFKAVLGIEKSAGYSDKNNIKAFVFEADASDKKSSAPAKTAATAKSAPAKGANPWD